MENHVVYDRLDDVLSAIEYNGGGISELLGKGCIKSVQRGYVSTSWGTSPSDKIIATVSPVNVQKSILLWNASGHAQSNLAWTYFAAAISFDGVNIKITGNYPNIQCSINWQVIEFY